MTFSAETVIHSFPMIDFERNSDFVVQSTATPFCTFGITVKTAPPTVNNDVITMTRNRKKLDNLLETLRNSRKYVDHFRKNDCAVPAELMRNIEQTEIEIQNLKQLMKS